MLEGTVGAGNILSNIPKIFYETNDHLYLFSGDYPHSSTEETCVPSANISNYCSPYLDPARSVYIKDGIRGVKRLEAILDGESK